MKNKNFFLRFTVLACCVLFLAALSGCNFGVLSSGSVENPKQAVVDFVDAMRAEEFDEDAAEAAMRYIGNYSSMGFEKFALVEDDELEGVLFDFLRSSYSVEFADSSLEPVSTPYQGTDMTISGKKAYITLTFTSLDTKKMSEPLSEMVAEVGQERMYDGEVFDTEETALALVEEIFPLVFGEDADMSEYCTERQLTLEMIYTDEGWKIVVSEEFYNALLGK